MADKARVVIVGAGMAGILSAVKLQEAGYTDFTVYEKADRLGGTWRENTYPGVACDVPSHLYSYSFAPNAGWSRWFSPGAEILAYLEDVADRHGVDRFIRYGSEICGMEWRDGRWHIETSTGERDEADFVIAATGVLHHPAYPEIEGLDTFAGATFHSARWDHDIPLGGKRVGLIGTGSTAVQIVCSVADEVGALDLFQRTAQWVLPMPNPEIGAEVQQAYRDDPAVMRSLKDELSRTFSDNFANAVVDAESVQVKQIAAMCLANLEMNVTDAVLREKLRPDYQAACKRLVVAPDFYQKVQRPHVAVVTEPIVRFEAGGVRTGDGVLHELDVLVLATGFRVDRFMRPMDVHGRDGTSLEDVWAERPSAYMAISIPQFPNLFMLNGPNGPVGNFSLIEVAELQFGYIMQLVDAVRRSDATSVCATAAAAERFEAERTEAAQKTVWVTGCRSWYLDDRGVPAAWPWTFDRFREAMAAPRMDDFELTRS